MFLSTIFCLKINPNVCKEKLKKKKKTIKAKKKKLCIVWLYVLTTGNQWCHIFRLIARSRLWILLITITITTARVGCSSRIVQAPWVIGHLQLKIPSQPYQLLMLLDSGLQFKEIKVNDKKKKKIGKKRKNSPLECWDGKDSPWH